MKKYVCIHGHFYQPPRENPWLEAIETQPSAYPFHDWNERITAECYGPNAASRVLDSAEHVVDLSNNYSRISFNFGPTLLSWLESSEPEVHKGILEADRRSMERFSGHGSALAQAYNHSIMPLSNERDRQTQVIWGIRDFEHRFKRKPEGMWLPETAVDTPTLEVLADQGIAFTLLAPRQAARSRRIGESEWQEATDERIDTTRPYLCRLPSGKEIALFFYNGAISREVAFEELLRGGHTFANRLRSALPHAADHDPLVHIATDGETYGHHHRFGDMALASALDTLDHDPGVNVTVYGEYLETHPPEFEVQIVENSSWSCEHGVERWRANCGCSTGVHPGWHQRWRSPLRDALDWMRDQVNPLFEREASDVFSDPWAARDDYIDIALNRTPATIESFLEDHAKQGATYSDGSRSLKLLELQRHLLLIYTSCGWFFDEISDIEPMKVLEYAARGVQLTRELFGTDLEPEFIKRLSLAESNLPERRDAAEIYVSSVRPRVIELEAVAAHGAISRLFDGDTEVDPAFEVSATDVKEIRLDAAKFVIGRIEVASRFTLEHAGFHFAALATGGHNVACGLEQADAASSPGYFNKQFAAELKSRDATRLAVSMNDYFGSMLYSFDNLFPDRRRRVLAKGLVSAAGGTDGLYAQLYRQQVRAIRLLREQRRPAVPVLRSSAAHFANSIIAGELQRTPETIDWIWARSLLGEAMSLDLPLDTRGLGLTLKQAVHNMLVMFQTSPLDDDAFDQFLAGAELATSRILEVDLWDAQATTYRLAHTDYVSARREADAGDKERARWAEQFRSVAAIFTVMLP